MGDVESRKTDSVEAQLDVLPTTAAAVAADFPTPTAGIDAVRMEGRVGVNG